MKTEELRLEALKTAEKILNTEYQKAVNKHSTVGTPTYPTPPSVTDITDLAEELVTFIFG